MAISFNKKIIAEAIQQVLAEAETVKKVIGPKGGSVAQAVSPEEEAELKKAGAKIEPMEEDHSSDPNAKYEVKPCDKEGEPWAVWEGEVRVKGFATEEEAQAYADKQNKEQGLTEGDYEPRTKEDLVFQYLRDAWQLGALKGKDFNPDEELSTMADSLITYLPDYDSAELEEARRGQGTIQKELDDVKAKMKELAKQYSAGDKSVVSTLKDLTAKKKALESELEDAVAKIGAGQEYEGEVDEVVQLDEIKAGEFAKIKKGTKIGLKGYGYVTVQDNDGVVLKVKDQFGEIFPINLGQYNEKAL